MAVKALAKSKIAPPTPRSRALDQYEFKDPAMKAWLARLVDSFTDEEAEALAKALNKANRRKATR
ncbi:MULTISPECIES: hypothetical protein [unclassified Meiothermus]|uniref:hypothetical protein n=1 Tax=unclassified Meiothermus TaxID=370471 RepID=UPI000D7CE26C|nr:MULTISPECIES: hypothetical protein [unclassified Meiothermus]PZA05737.1 hypothetical protein DNA98_17110 [Meiothermus sp. Pnk-1]RYM30755.1 hypothetical protein EWH23_15065 [Meiothermus sp. PNK-Is4]